MKSRPRSVHVISPYAAWRQNENRSRHTASAPPADLGPLKPSAFDKAVITSWRWRTCPRCRDIFGIENEKEAGPCGADGRITSSHPHEWLMSVRGDSTPFPLHHYSTCPSQPFSLYLSGRCEELARLQRNRDPSFLTAPEKQGLGSGGEKRNVKDSFASLTPSLAVLDNTHTHARARTRTHTSVCRRPLERIFWKKAEEPDFCEVEVVELFFVVVQVRRVKGR